MISSQPKFQVKYGPWSTDYIIVDADELDKLHYAKKLGAYFTGKYGDVDTTKIISVRPDFKETYGAMPEYELVGEDYDEIQAQHGDIRVLVGQSEDRVRHLIETNQEHLIGKTTEVLVSKNPVSGITKELASKMSIHAKTRTEAQEEANSQNRKSANLNPNL